MRLVVEGGRAGVAEVRPVLGVDGLQERLVGDVGAVRPPEDPTHLVGAEERVGFEVPFPVAEVRDALGPSQPLFTFPELPLHGFAVRDVVDHAGHAGCRAVLHVRLASGAHPSARSVGGHERQLELKRMAFLDTTIQGRPEDGLGLGGVKADRRRQVGLEPEGH
jgi:hypothetical protein